MLEWHVVLGPPAELGAEAGVDAFFVVALGCDVADLLLAGLERLEAGVELGPLEHGKLRDVADVAHGLELVQVLSVVDEVEHEVVLHGDVKSLHLLGLGASRSSDRALHGVLRVHEGLILRLDLVNNARRVDSVPMSIPVNLFQVTALLVLVVVVEEALQLTVRVSRRLVGCRRSQSLQPDAGQISA